MHTTGRSGKYAHDIVGVGALNLDYIVHGPTAIDSNGKGSLVERLAELMTELDPPLTWNVERAVSESAIETAIRAMPANALAVALGGSAFNTIHALATMRLGLRLGYLGVTGRVPAAAPSFYDEFDSLGIDRTHVRALDKSYAGICLSVMESGEPTMLTHIGANLEMANVLSEGFDTIVEDLASARMVHVTSFLDPLTPRELLKVLNAVKQRNPQTLLSLDPGHEWCMRRSPAFKGLLALSDFLFVNELELRALASEGPTHDDDQSARWILRRFMGPKSVLVVKKPSGVGCYRMVHGEITVDRYTHTPLPTSSIIDATGAGDVFVAGLLAGVLNDPSRLAPGALLGMRLAKLHLQYVGAHGQERFADIAREFVLSPPAGQSASNGG